MERNFTLSRTLVIDGAEDFHEYLNFKRLTYLAIGFFMLIFDIVFLVFFAIQFGSSYLQYYNLITNIILTSALIANLALAAKYNFFLHFIGINVLINFMSLLVLYKFQSTDSRVILSATQTAYLFLYIIITFFMNSFWIIHGPLYVITYYIYALIQGSYINLSSSNWFATMLGVGLPIMLGAISYSLEKS